MVLERIQELDCVLAPSQSPNVFRLTVRYFESLQRLRREADRQLEIGTAHCLLGSEVAWLSPEASGMIGLAHSGFVSQEEIGACFDGENLTRLECAKQALVNGAATSACDLHPNQKSSGAKGLRWRFRAEKDASTGSTVCYGVAQNLADRGQEDRWVLDFVASAAHDLRAPARNLLGLASVLREDYEMDLPPGAQALVARIGQKAVRIDRLVAALLEFSRLSTEEVAVQVVDLDDVVQEAVDLVADLIGQQEARILIRPGLGSAFGHYGRLAACLANLISNAIKYSKPGERPFVTVNATRSRGRVQICVSDQGIGVDPLMQHLLFQPFRKLHRFDDVEGTGLGLAIVKRSVEKMGGSVGASSTPGMGSTFWVELPTPASLG